MNTNLRTETEQVIFQSGAGGYREYRIPGILPLKDGALLLACESRAENKGDWGDIDIAIWRREKDGALAQVLRIGQSHLPPDGSMRTYNNPVLVPDGQNVHLLYHLNYERAFIRSSEDGGHTWGEAREITAAYREFPFAWNAVSYTHLTLPTIA